MKTLRLVTVAGVLGVLGFGGPVRAQGEPVPRGELTQPYVELAPHLGRALGHPTPWRTRVDRCWERGDNDCVVRLLGSRPLDSADLRRLISALRARGNGPRARARMVEYIGRFGSSPETDRYRRLLARHQPRR